MESSWAAEAIVTGALLLLAAVWFRKRQRHWFTLGCVSAAVVTIAAGVTGSAWLAAVAVAVLLPVGAYDYLLERRALRRRRGRHANDD
ncbi:hypothetical protein [Amycolatopsis suaedae]|uniref:Uncharacterized protein n=1 Tax=Amycolatopsis suaedae TaxID=2510978 RepID=A0A4Q7JBC8_9PSEU|nr:hypothetical protein [Amycolatopsis suaedae]RZQ64587.1 hypothetical protein EWH70_06680 [Amycolatopsis suaedae]